jgi:hypothetical protein
MANILVTATRNTRPGIRKTTLSHKVRVGSVSLTIVLIIMTSIVSLIYLLYANKNATKGYVIKNLEKERTKLILEAEKWDMQIAKAKSLDSLKNNPLVANMVKYEEQPLFIRGDTAVATSKQ